MHKILDFSGIEVIINRESLERRLNSGKKLRIKFGADPSRPDIHLGHSVGLRLLKRFQEAGHQIIFLIGDYTAKIGDPSGRNKTRPILNDAEIKANAKTYVSQASKVIDMRRAEVRFNSQWYRKFSFADLIKISSSFTVAKITERDDFAKRLKENQEVGLHELLYPVMQAYDSVVLSADVEIGGSDQRFNMLAGRELQKKLGQAPQEIITTKLLIGTDGKEKMSKSLGNFIAVTDNPLEMFGKVMSIRDEQIENYLELCTDFDEAVINEYKKRLGDGFNPRDIKFALATEITRIYYSQKDADVAGKSFNQIHQKKENPSQISSVSISGEISIVELVKATGFVESNNEARRMITGGGVKVDGAVISTIETKIATYSGMVVQVGKRNFIRIK